MQMLITIIVPVYNDVALLPNCINSLIKQTYSNIEIIFVDDCSDDGSEKVLSEAANSDSRISVLKEADNKGTSKARKDGVAKSKGDYILFVDADDELDLNTCKELVLQAECQRADIIHYGMKCLAYKERFDNKVNALDSFFQPIEGKQNIDYIREKCLCEGSLAHNLCGKMIDGSICRKAFSALSDDRLLMGEDLYAFFSILMNARSYYGYCRGLYIYNYGIGIMEDNNVAKAYENFCSQGLVVKKCMDLASEFDGDIMHYVEGISNTLRRSVIKFIISNADYIKQMDFYSALDKYWDKKSIAKMLIETADRLRKEKLKVNEKIWLVPYGAVKKGSRIAIYGAGDVGCDYCRQIIESGYASVVIWVDKNADKIESQKNLPKVQHTDELNQVDFDVVLLAVNKKGLQKEIKVELTKKYHIDESIIVCAL